jgi:hypothetical protein
MTNLNDKLINLDKSQLELILQQAETRLNETLTTFNLQRNRLSEIIKFCIPVLGALVYKAELINTSKELDQNAITVLIILGILATIAILVVSVILYLPTQISINGCSATQLFKNGDFNTISKESRLKPLLIKYIQQVEEGIDYNIKKNSKLSKHLKTLTIVILAFSCQFIFCYLIILMCK